MQNVLAMNKNDIVITGEWDGQPIWREKTSGEKLLEAIEKEKHDKTTNNPRATEVSQ